MTRHSAIVILLSAVAMTASMTTIMARAATAIRPSERAGIAWWAPALNSDGWQRGHQQSAPPAQFQAAVARTPIGIARPRETVTRTARPRELSATELFDDTRLHEVRLSINSKDLKTLRVRYLENIYLPADIDIDGTRVRNVAVRSRGAGSRNPSKLGLRVDFDHYTAGQRFRGLAALVLDNLWQDGSMIREMLAMKIFRTLGEIAPRESFCRVFINGRYQGVYALVEEIDEDFAVRTTGEWGGYLYEYHYAFPFFGDDLGPGYELYQMLFEPRTHEDESVDQLYGPLRNLFHGVNQPDGARWLETAGEQLDLPQFMRVLGVEAFVGEVDGLLGYWGMNNFYLYRSPGTLKYQVFPWDRDHAFWLDTASLLRGVDQNVIARAAYAQPELRATYLNTIERAAIVTTDGGWLETEIDRLAALIDRAAREDPLKQFSNDQFDEEVEAVRNVARIRPSLLLGEVNRERP
jgi:hypothetical protein